jgi:hypothetical protein
MLIPTQPPWSLWGNSQTIDLPPVAPVNFVTPLPNTLVRVQYGRPETWRFLFHVQNQTQGLANTLPGETAQIEVSFDVIVGVGRSAVTIPDFKTFAFIYGNGGFLFAGWTAFATSTFGVNQIGGTPDPPPLIDLIPGQDITIVAKAAHLSDSVVPGASPTAKVAISAMLTPNVHVRPDWHLDSGLQNQFQGGEIGGR